MKEVYFGSNSVSVFFAIHVCCYKVIYTAFGVGAKAVADALNKPDMPHDGSDYSEGRRQRALGLEEIKFFRAINEGETPSTLMSDKEGITSSISSVRSDPVIQAHAAAAAAAAISSPSSTSRRVMQTIMDQSHGGLFEVPPQSKRSFRLEEVPEAEGAVQLLNQADPERSEISGKAVEPPEIREPPKPISLHLDNFSPAVQLNTPSATTLAPSMSPSTSGTTAADAIYQSQEKKLRVLVVDDDALTRKLMIRLLTRLGCIVEAAENGKIALEKILGGNVPAGTIPDLIASAAANKSSAEGDVQLHTYLYDVIFLDNQMVSACS